MTTNASPIADDYSEGFFNISANNGMAPARKKILLIDDQSEASLFIALQKEGYEVTAVESPQRAWSLVWTLRPHFIIIHLTNPSRGDISSLQGCGVLAGGVPIIIAAPVSGGGTIGKALEKVAPVFLSFPLGPHGIGKILHDLDMSDRGIDSGVCHGGRTVVS
jgi:DNA-binding NtrC family response regulator